MSVVLLNLFESGHLNPMLGVAKQLVDGGFNVVFFNAPQAKKQVEATGATFRPYLDDPNFDLFAVSVQATEQHTPHVEASVAQAENPPDALVPAALDVVPWLCEAVKAVDPVFVMFDAYLLWGAIVGHVLKIPAVCLMTAHPATPVPSTAPAALRAAVDKLNETYGTNLDARRTYTSYTTLNVFTVPPVLTLPQDLPPNATNRVWGVMKEGMEHRLETSFDKATMKLMEKLQKHKGEHKGEARVVLCSLGTVVTRKRRPWVLDLYKVLWEAFAGEKSTMVLLAIGQDSPLVIEDGALVDRAVRLPIPKHFVVHRSFAQLHLLHRTTVFISHCGMNSVAEALHVRVPVIGVPCQGDQIENAQRLQRLGVACTYLGFAQPNEPHLTAEWLRASVDELSQKRREMVWPKEEELSGCGATLKDKVDALLLDVEEEGERLRAL